MQLRNYQSKLINSIRKAFTKMHYRVIMQAATGAGKTVMFSYIVKEAVKKK